jgi:NADH dehydrogenase
LLENHDVSSQVHVVTGAFGFSGQYIARRLLQRGHAVHTLTNSPHRKNPFGEGLRSSPFSFDDAGKLAESLKGASVLYNTYWVRFNHRDFKQAGAVENTLRLFAAAEEAGVGRVVHISITNPTRDSHLEYFSGKARLEEALMDSGLSYAILRPAVLFGKEDILINNIAWLLRRFPVFGVFGDGQYKLQPIYVDDLAEIAVDQGHSNENCIIDAVGPETFTYRELVTQIGQIIGRPRPIISVPPRLGYWVSALLGTLVHDVVITRDELEGLMAGLLHVESPPIGRTKLTQWAREHADLLGRRYASELARRRNRVESYEEL